MSYTSNSGDDDFSFYIYHLYWWEFNVHSKLKLVCMMPPHLALGEGRLLKELSVVNGFTRSKDPLPADIPPLGCDPEVSTVNQG